MILVVSVLAATALALIRGGAFERLATISIRYGPLILLGLVVQILLFSPLLGPRLARWQVGLLYNLTMVLLLGTLALNRRLPGVPLMMLGLLLNWFALTANGGFMPASRAALEASGRFEPRMLEPGARTNNSILMTDSSRLRPLGDIFAVPAPLPLSNVFSVGDVLLAVGAGYLVYSTMRRDPAAARPPLGDPA